MQIGIILPQNEIGDDPGAIREFAQAAEEEGFKHIVAFDHVVGKDDYASQPFHEPFVLFGFIAAITRTIELVTGIIILPQRQTALAAKQAAEVDMLSARPAAPRARRGLEPAGVRGAGRGLPHARQAHGRADPAHAAALDGAPRDRRDRPRAAHGRGPQPAGDPQHPDLAGRQGPGGRAPRRDLRRGADPLRPQRERRGDVHRDARPAPCRRRRGRPAARGARHRGLARDQERAIPTAGAQAVEKWAALGATHLSVETYADDADALRSSTWNRSA